MENESRLITIRLNGASDCLRRPSDEKPLKSDVKYKSDDLKFGVREKAEIGKNCLHKFSVNQ
jgi:hypothetical protein